MQSRRGFLHQSIGVAAASAAFASEAKVTRERGTKLKLSLNAYSFDKPLRAGTMNYIARSIGCMRGGPEHVLAHVAHDYRHGRTHDVVERHLLVVNDEHAGFVFGCGVIVNYLQLYYSEPKAGPVTATRLRTTSGSACQSQARSRKDCVTLTKTSRMTRRRCASLHCGKHSRRFVRTTRRRGTTTT